MLLMTTRPSDQSKYFSHHKNGVLLSSTQPSRRTLVKGAAWSVPVVAVASTTPAHAASPNCQITVSVRCDGDALVFSWNYVSGGVGPGSENFTLVRSGDTNKPAEPEELGGASYSGGTGGGTLTVPVGETPPATPVDILRVPAPGANNGTSSYTLTGPCANVSNSACGAFRGNTCVGSCANANAAQVGATEATEEVVEATEEAATTAPAGSRDRSSVTTADDEPAAVGQEDVPAGDETKSGVSMTGHDDGRGDDSAATATP